MIGHLLVAFSAGALSFFAPCVVPLLPAYVSYVGGAALPEIQRDPAAFQARVIRGGLLYVAGFGMVFVGLGVAAGFLGAGLRTHEVLLQRGGGVVVIVMGAALLGWLPAHLGERSLTLFQPRPGGTGVAPLLLGVVFGTAWTPCVGPVLGAVLVLAAQRQGAVPGGLLLLAYTAGLGLPFILTSLLIASHPPLLRPVARFASKLSLVAGILLVLLGLMLVLGLYQSIAGYLAQPFTLH